MLQYLVILLDDTSVAYCHADNPLSQRRLMDLDLLKKAVLFAMKENLTVQYVYPDYDLPVEYEEVIESIDNMKIGRDISVLTSVPAEGKSDNVVLRVRIADFIKQAGKIAELMPQIKRLNVCFTDVESFTDEMTQSYKSALSVLSDAVMKQYEAERPVQVNILTDRLHLTKMRNCDAGLGNITLAPNGKFYLCPAFYYAEATGAEDRMHHDKAACDFSVGDIDGGINIPNKQLLDLEHAPLCRKCDAYHCNRCIYLNAKLTWDNNTPSHQQCVMAHLERNASMELQKRMIEKGARFEQTIEAIDYLDPFDAIDN